MVDFQSGIMAWYFKDLRWWNKLKYSIMKKSLALVLGALAAFGFYKYSKMSQEQKNNLKAKGKDLLDKSMSGNLFGKNQTV